jgi:hypothetical protein
MALNVKAVPIERWNASEELEPALRSSSPIGRFNEAWSFWLDWLDVRPPRQPGGSGGTLRPCA